MLQRRRFSLSKTLQHVYSVFNILDHECKWLCTITRMMCTLRSFAVNSPLTLVIKLWYCCYFEKGYGSFNVRICVSIYFHPSYFLKWKFHKRFCCCNIDYTMKQNELIVFCCCCFFFVLFFFLFFLFFVFFLFVCFFFCFFFVFLAVVFFSRCTEKAIPLASTNQDNN